MRSSISTSLAASVAFNDTRGIVDCRAGAELALGQVRQQRSRGGEPVRDQRQVGELEELLDPWARVPEGLDDGPGPEGVFLDPADASGSWPDC